MDAATRISLSRFIDSRLGRRHHHPVDRTVIHLDMDAFFASVEIKDDPSLAGKPVIVGGASDRGVVSAASYEARKFGVHSAMPAVRARKLCPHGVFLRGRMQRYKEESQKAMAVLYDVSPLVEQTSVDEAYVDATGLTRHWRSPEELGRHLKRRIKEETGLTCSVGIAPNKFLSKVASDWDKPDGLFVIRPEDVAGFLRDLPVGKIPGVGPKTREALERLGARTCGDILGRPPDYWERRFGERGLVLYERAMGVHESPVVPESDPKSTSAENTFEKDVVDAEELERWMWRQSERVGSDLRRKGFLGRTVTVKIKYDNFEQHTRSLSLPEAVCADESIWKAALRLLHQAPLARPVRLIGVGVSGLVKESRQLSLMPEHGDQRLEKLDKTIDEIRERFGRDALRRGRVLGGKD
jgi:DNA polymerase-4